MAYGVKPPHLGEWIVNLGEAAEYMFDHNIFQENLVGWTTARGWSPRQPGRARPSREHRGSQAAAHGYRTIADIMRALNPFTGELYREALQVSRGRGRCSASWRGGTSIRPLCTPAASAPVATIQLMTDY
jgi:hydrogenase large subunit